MAQAPVFVSESCCSCCFVYFFSPSPPYQHTSNPLSPPTHPTPNQAACA